MNRLATHVFIHGLRLDPPSEPNTNNRASFAILRVLTPEDHLENAINLLTGLAQGDPAMSEEIRRAAARLDKAWHEYRTWLNADDEPTPDDGLEF